jgi:hypothetical protein
MSNEDVLKLAIVEPELVDSLTKALRRALEFYRGRGALLRDLDASTDRKFREPHAG